MNEKSKFIFNEFKSVILKGLLKINLMSTDVNLS